MLSDSNLMAQVVLAVITLCLTPEPMLISDMRLASAPTTAMKLHLVQLAYTVTSPTSPVDILPPELG